MTEKEIWFVEFGPDVGKKSRFVKATQTEIKDYLKYLIVDELKKAVESGCECNGVSIDDVSYEKHNHTLEASANAWYNHELGGVQDQYHFDVKAISMKNVEVQEPHLERHKTSPVRKHAEFDHSTIKNVLWYKERNNWTPIRPMIEEALENAMRKNPLVSYVRRPSKDTLLCFYTLFDDEVVGKFVANRNDNTIKFLHNGDETIVPWRTDTIQTFKSAIEAYAGGYDEFESFLANHHL